MSTTWHADELSKVSSLVRSRYMELMFRNGNAGYRYLKKNNRIYCKDIPRPNTCMLQRISLLPSDPSLPLESESHLSLMARAKGLME
jgi:hypothetical protein